MSTTAHIYLDNILTNYQSVQSLIPNDTKICASVKANAYGHGLIETVQYLHSHTHVDYWGIAHISEAQAIVDLNIGGMLLCYIQLFSQDLHYAILNDIELMVGDKEYLMLINNTAKSLKHTAKIHLMLETGMGREGFLPANMDEAYDVVMHSSYIDLKGFCSHFSQSSNDKSRNAQLKILRKKIQDLQIPKEVLIHIANSGAIIWDKSASFDMVRPGIMLYGASPEPHRTLPSNLILKQAMRLTGKIASLQRYPKGQGISYMSNFICTQETNIAVVNIGYGDGLMRSLSNKGVVNIAGTRYPIVGNVCMDMCMINLGDDVYKIGAEVVFFGDEIIHIDEQSEHAESISYVLTTQLTPRCQKVYHS